jgi:UDP-N-acetylglucosamine 2-epimerase (non-hydrolysing)
MKIAPIVRALARRPERVTTRLVHTGQHYDTDMSEVFWDQLGIPRPDLELEAGSGTHAAQTAAIMSAYEPHLSGARAPDWVVVVGDVNSTLACALTASKLGVKIAHVEAGLRSFDRSMPEEINRQVTDLLSDLLLVSDPAGIDNLTREGIDPAKIVFVGNVMIDTLVNELPRARALDMPTRHGLRAGEYGYVTLHRPGNVDERERLAELVGHIARSAELLPLVFAVHPRTRARLEEFALWERLRSSPSVTLLGPQGYHESTGLLASARLVITDSGGIQEEASYLSVPCLTMRPSTERPVTVTRGTSVLLGEAPERLSAEVRSVLASERGPGSAIEGWDGEAAERAVKALLRCAAEPGPASHHADDRSG